MKKPGLLSLQFNPTTVSVVLCSDRQGGKEEQADTNIGLHISNARRAAVKC